MSESVTISTYGKIMIVDNDVIIHDCMRALLDDLFRVVTMHTALEGLECLECLETDGPFDIVMSSFALQYSGMNGLEFLRRVGELSPVTLRILMSGGCGDKVDINLALREGHIHRFVSKPFSTTTLREQLKSDLRSIGVRVE